MYLASAAVAIRWHRKATAAKRESLAESTLVGQTAAVRCLHRLFLSFLGKIQS